MGDVVRHNQRGGKFLDQGSYGCTFLPAMKCNDGTSLPGKLGKVFWDDRDATVEQRNNTIVTKLDPGHKFTVQLYNTCTTASRKQGVGQCSFMNGTERSREFQQLVYEYGGYDFQSLYNRVAKNFVPFEGVAAAFETVMFGLVVLQVHGYCHFDITLKNILYDEATRRATLIDFGFLMPLDRVYEPDNRSKFAHEYLFYGPELKVAALVLDGTLGLTSYETFFARFVSNCFKSKKLPFATYTKLFPDNERGLRELYLGLREAPGKAFRELKQFSNKVDVYSAGMVMLCMLVRYASGHRGATIGSAGLEKDVLALVGRMTRFDPRARPDAVQAYSQFASVLRRHGMKPEFAKHPIVRHAKDLRDLRHTTVSELRSMCGRIGVRTTGSKADLVSRIAGFVQAVPEQTDSVSAVSAVLREHVGRQRRQRPASVASYGMA